MDIHPEFLEIPSNPVPRRVVVTVATADDGRRLRAAYWRQTKNPCRGTVCILQGRGEFIEKYFEVIRELRRRGFAVVAFDWRGQGRSDREVRNPHKGHIADFSAYRRDVKAIEQQILARHMPKPYFALAYSMGGAIALDMAAERSLPFERVIAVSPMLGIRLVRKPRLALALASLLCFLGFSKAFVPGGGETSISTRPFARNRLSSDPVRYARASQLATTMDAGAVGAPTIGWIKAAFRLIRRLGDPKLLHHIETPFLFLTAGDDTICDPFAAERAAARIRTCQAISIGRSRHEMLLEQDDVRRAFWAAFDAFIPGTPAA